jgi:hypothetical protein
MKTSEKHRLWELEVEGFEQVILASDLIRFMSGGTSDIEISQSMLKSYIAKSSAENGSFAKCCNCCCAVYFVASNATTEAHFRHNPNRAPSIEKMQKCHFYSNSESFFGKSEIYKGEGKWHFETKHFLAKHLKSIGYLNVEVEKFMFSKDPDVDRRRKPDIAFRDHQGNMYIIELTRWWMSPEVVYEREKFFRLQGYNLIWLFSPNCLVTNAATLNLILYGSAASREDASTDVLSKVECNAFILTDEARDIMEDTKDLVFEVLFPVAHYNPELGVIEIDKRDKLTTLSELNLDPHKRLPYAVCTSSSFKLAIAKKQSAERKSLAIQLIQLRQLAYIEPFFTHDTDADVAVHEIYHAFDCNSKTKSPLRLIAYKSMAIANVNTATNKFLARKYRSNAASAFKKARIAIKTHLTSINNAHNVTGIADHIRNIKHIGDEVSQYSSTAFTAFLSKVLLKAYKRVDAIVSHQKIIDKSRQEAQQRAIDNKIKQREAFIKEREGFITELDTFIAELELGFSDLPEDVGMFELRISQIRKKAIKYGCHQRAEYIVQAFKKASQDAQRAFEIKHYPLLSQGWSSELRYKRELDCALALCKQEIEHRADWKRIQSYQNATRLVLTKFLINLSFQIERLYDDLRLSDQPTFSSQVQKITKREPIFVRLRDCFLHIEMNDVPVELNTSKKLSAICKAIEAFQSGTPLRSVLDELSNFHRDNFLMVKNDGYQAN